jgi:hypothetical protein
MIAALASGIAFAEPAKVLKATEVRATPAPGGDVVAKLKANDAVDITLRQGAWANIKTAEGIDGWARVLNLRSASAGTGDGGRADFGALFATGSTGATSTTGAKGLNASDLMNASPDGAELAELDGFAATAPDAQGFAAQAPVQARQVAYLPAGRSR